MQPREIPTVVKVMLDKYAVWSRASDQIVLEAWNQFEICYKEFLRDNHERVMKVVGRALVMILRECGDEFATIIKRGAADYAAILHDTVNPQIRKQLVTVLGNSAEGFRSMIGSVAERFAREKLGDLVVSS